jgi:catechol 2,3-dioxygenase-like lactoylglutathione lyase family enzyme
MDQGELKKTRREFLALISASAAAARTARPATDQAPEFTTLDHVQISVPDAARSAAYYAHIFGGPVWKNNKTPRRYILLGPAYLAIDEMQPAGRVDHFSASARGFQIGSVHSYLEQRGITWRDFPSGRDLSVSDPDRIQIELSAENTWTQLQGRTASPEAGPAYGEALFRPAGLDHILLNVSDPEKSTPFYEKLFGPVTRRNNNRTWFQTGKSRIGLLRTPDGQHNGVNHFCVLAAPFDYSAVTKKLEQSGARLETPEVAGAPEFRDPDGVLVQVMSSAAARA